MFGSERSLPGIPTPLRPSRTDVPRQAVRSRACDVSRHTLADTTAWTYAAWSADLAHGAHLDEGTLQWKARARISGWSF